jgi:hypothetical protein
MGSYPRSAEPLRLLAAQRDRGAIDSKLERIAAQGRTEKRELRALDEAEHHQALDGGILGIDRLDANAITGLEVRQRQRQAPARLYR